MSTVYLNEDLTTGLNDGSSEANAFQTWPDMVVAEATTLTADLDIFVKSDGIVSTALRALNSSDGWVVGSFILGLIGDTKNIQTLFYDSSFDRVFQSDIDNIEVHNIDFDGGNRSVEMLGSNQKYVNCTAKNSGSAGFHKAGDLGAGGECFAINCIAYNNNDAGFVASAWRNLEVINGYSGNNTGLDYEEETNGTLIITTSASEDATGSAGLQNVPYDTSTFTNVIGGSEDLHIVPGSDLVDSGTITSYLTDMAGDTWSVPRDIGVFNFSSSEPVSISGTIDGTGTIIGSLTIAESINLSGTVDGVGDIIGSLTVAGEVSLSGTVDGIGDIQGSLTIIEDNPISLSGNIDGIGDVTGTLTIAGIGEYYCCKEINSNILTGKLILSSIKASKELKGEIG